MREPDFDELLKKEINATMPAADRAQLDSFLSGSPEAQAAWAEEVRLNGLLRQLPDAPISSNFTSLVMRAVEAEQRVAPNHGGVWSLFRWRGWGWATRGAIAVGVILTASVSVRLYESAQREQVANSVAAFSKSVPQQFFDILTQFDEIKLLPASLPSVGAAQQSVDLELLSANP